MNELVVIVPSRGRPHAVAELVQAFRETCTMQTTLVVAIDDDDPKYIGYMAFEAGTVLHITEGPSTMVKTLNDAAMRFSRAAPAIAFMGDDHRPRTIGWDAAYLNALTEMRTGIVYGNDLFQGEAIPTQVAMTTDIIRALGHMAPPELTHLFVDNYWKDLGNAAGCLRYLPGVVVEHLHPFAGKGDLDEGYHRVNAPSMYANDQHTYALYVDYRLAADITKVRGLR